MRKIAVIGCILVLACSLAGRAGQFQNLGFDEPDPSVLVTNEFGLVSGEGPVSKVLPGWSLSYGTNILPVDVNMIFGSEVPYASIFNVGYFVKSGFALEFFVWATNPPPWRLEQAGTIPSDARFMVYRSYKSELQVNLNGQVIPPLNPPAPGASPYGISPYPTNLVYDFAKFAGQDVTLAFVGPFGGRDPFTGTVMSWADIDNIQFLPVPPLNFAANGNQLVLSWLVSSQSVVLEEANGLGPAANWLPVTIQPVTNGNLQSVTVPIENQAQFFRLTLAPHG
jgi:hypothetical protein